MKKVRGLNTCKTCNSDLPRDSMEVWHTFTNGLPITNHCSKGCADIETVRRKQSVALDKFFNQF